MHSGRLWSPEGHGFSPGDSDWWGLLVRKAALFKPLYDRAHQLDLAMQRTHQGLGDVVASTSGQAQDWPVGDGSALPDRRSRAHGEAVGLVPSKTTLDSSLQVLENDVNMTSQRHQSDVRIDEWPTLSDFPTPSTLPPEYAPTTLESALTPSFASPWMPSYGLRLNLLPFDQSQLAASWSHLKQSLNPPQCPNLPRSPERKSRPCTKPISESGKNSFGQGSAAKGDQS
jgi:hypothetical protein